MPNIKLFDRVWSKEKKIVLSNFKFLAILQIFNYILPFITVPYLVRVLGLDNFGIIMFAQAVIVYFNLLVDYGFNFSATREVSLYRNDYDKLSEIYTSVYLAKLILLFLSFIILTIIIFSFERLNEDWKVYYFTFGIVVGHALLPVWFFQGKEDMKFITVLNITAKTIFTIMIFIFIQTKEDYYIVPILNSLGFIVSGFIGFYLVSKELKFKLPNWSYFLLLFKESSSLFVSNLSVSLYTASNTIVLGLLTNNMIVGVYSSIEKIIVAFKTLYIPLYQAIYPWISRKEKNTIFLYIKKLIIPIGISGIMILIFLLIFSENILLFLYANSEVISYKYIFIILAIVPLLSSLNMLFNMLFLTSMNMNFTRMKIMIYAGVINIFLATFLTFLFGILGIALSFVFIELLLLVVGYYHFMKVSK